MNGGDQTMAQAGELLTPALSARGCRVRWMRVWVLEYGGGAGENVVKV